MLWRAEARVQSGQLLRHTLLMGAIGLILALCYTGDDPKEGRDPYEPGKGKGDLLRAALERRNTDGRCPMERCISTRAG